MTANSGESVPVRTPVPENETERFIFMVCILAKTMGIEDQPELRHYVELLTQACERHVFEQQCGRGASKVGENEDRKRIIVLFKARYLQSYDMEYSRRVTPVDGRVLGTLAKELQALGITPDEYLRWAFEEFLEENPRMCPPSLRLLGSAIMIDRFKYEFRQQIKDRHELQLRVKEGLDLITRARAQMRVGNPTPEKLRIIKGVLQAYREQRIMIAELRQVVQAMEQDDWSKLGKYEAKDEQG